MPAGESATHLAGSVTSAARSPGWLSTDPSTQHGRFQPGSLLGERFRILGLIGRGGMGEVYRADDLRLGQPVALKFLPAALTRDPARLTQFHNEVRTARQVSHPNVCRVYDIGEIDGLLFLTMEYVDGEDLASLLRRIGRLPEDKALVIARQICAGLAAAHERGVLHRDLKPANVMLDGAGKVRLMDFGLASAGPVADVRAGTPAYMAPEQLEGREVTIRSDIFALGLLLYELFTGRRVFNAATIGDLALQHASNDITAPSEIVRTLDPAVERAILRCLAADPARRPSSVPAVAASLPGADPLAAALAAGETPSPELVAAAGSQAAAIGPLTGVMLLAALVTLGWIHAAVQPLVSIPPRVPMTRSRPVLVDRAQTLLQTFGYTEPAGDAASGFFYNSVFLNWAFNRGAGADRYAILTHGRPAAIRFWYRESPGVMVPFDRIGPVRTNDPPLQGPRMVRIDLDLAGRLAYFLAVPSEAADRGPMDWRILFEAAGLDPAAFTETEPSFRPPSFADERKSWRGVLPELPGVPVELQAAAYRGRLVMYGLALEPDAPPTGAVAVGESNPLVRIAGMLMFAAIPIAAAVLARQNLRLGRSDRRGAFRVWAAIFGANVVAWIVAPVHVGTLAEIDRMFAALAMALLWSGVAYLAYLALEPYVRRTLPAMLISWSRLLDGRIGDPLVGRDLLIGTVAGLAIVTATSLLYLVPRLLGWPDALPERPLLAPLAGYRETFAFLARAPFEATLEMMQGIFVLALLRHGLMRLAQRIGRPWIGSIWIAGALVSALYLVIVMRSALDGTYPALHVAQTLVTGVGILILAIRLGLFAGIVAFLVVSLAGSLPWTLDPSKIYAGPVFMTMGLVAGLAVAGFWRARAPARPS